MSVQSQMAYYVGRATLMACDFLLMVISFWLLTPGLSMCTSTGKTNRAGLARSPLKSIRVVTDENFLLGRESTQDGGPKGIDLDHSTSILVTTCKVQPLAFFDLAGILVRISRTTADEEQKALEMKYELDVQDEFLAIQDKFKDEIAQIKNSRSWRITAPLRWTGSLLRALRR
jgi:hypothetical protein